MRMERSYALNVLPTKILLGAAWEPLFKLVLLMDLFLIFSTGIANGSGFSFLYARTEGLRRRWLARKWRSSDEVTATCKPGLKGERA